MDNKNRETYHHGALIEALLDLALKKLADGIPLQKISVRALAAELGETKGAPRRHFATSDDLRASLAHEGFVMLNQHLQTEGGQELSHLGAEYIRFAVKHPQIYKAMFYFPSNQHYRFPELQRSAGEAYGILVSSVQKQKNGTSQSSLEVNEAAIGD
jgi:hypothetical protein